MMRAFALVLVVSIALASFTPLLAADDHKTAKGTITKWDDKGKSFTVKDKAGKEMTFTWDEKTVVAGSAKKEGETVLVKYTIERGDKNWANHVYVGDKEIKKHQKQ